MEVMINIPALIMSVAFPIAVVAWWVKFIGRDKRQGKQHGKED